MDLHEKLAKLEDARLMLYLNGMLSESENLNANELADRAVRIADAAVKALEARDDTK